jgi:hypothetical protein
MRHLAGLLALLALGLSACSEATADVPPPMDAFYYPVGLALYPRASGGESLLVTSSDIDLRYGPNDGSTLLTVEPVYTLGTAGPLTVVGGVRLGSYAGPVTLATAATCPGYTGPPQALVASRRDRQLYRFDLDANGAPTACPAAGCALPLDPDLLDPFDVALACRADGARRSAFVGYLSSPYLGVYPSGTAWVSELDLEQNRPLHTMAIGSGPVAEMAFDAATDRLFAVGRWDGQVAPLYVLDLYAIQRGAELTSLALANPVAGRPLRVYVTAALYDADQATLTGQRPSFDVGGVLMILDIVEDASGVPSVRLVRIVDAGLGTGQVRVLPPRAGQRDLVVWANGTAGTLTVYDDDAGAVSSVLALDASTGAPVVGREPFGVTVSDQGANARVYVAAFNDSTVAVVNVPQADPGSATFLGRIGSVRPQ